MKFGPEYYQSRNYKDYLSRKFEGQRDDLISMLGLSSQTRVLDFGCATGGLVDAFLRQGIITVGTDISPWAIEHGRQRFPLNPDQLQHYNRQLLQDQSFAVTLFMDVLEHMHNDELETVLSLLRSPRLVIRVPVCAQEGEDFVLDVSRNDKTHIQIHCKDWWSASLWNAGYRTEVVCSTKSIYDSPGVLARVFKKRQS
jgi:SAM-dependent methyltransferase